MKRLKDAVKAQTDHTIAVSILEYLLERTKCARDKYFSWKISIIIFEKSLRYFNYIYSLV